MVDFIMFLKGFQFPNEQGYERPTILLPSDSTCHFLLEYMVRNSGTGPGRLAAIVESMNDTALFCGSVW